MAETLTRRASSPTALLTAARIGEQGMLAAALLLLALRLPVATFGAASLMVAFQSVAVTASDYGLGLAVLSAPPGVLLDQRRLDRMRRWNRSIVGGGLLGAAALAVLGEHAISALVFVGVAIWATSAEAYVRKACALRGGRPGAVAKVEMAGSVLFLVIVVMGATGAAAVAVLGAAFVSKSLLEVLTLPRALDGTFGPAGGLAASGWIWLSQVLSYAISNIDYAIVALLLGPHALGLYSLAFRAASLVTSQVSHVLVRVTTVNLARMDAEERASTVMVLARRLFVAGAILGVLGALASPHVEVLLGARWSEAAPLMSLLFLAIPCRLVLPFTGVVALVDGRAQALCRAELVRLVAVLAALSASSFFGIRTLTAVAAITMAATTWWMVRFSPVRVPERAGEALGPWFASITVSIGGVWVLM